VQYSLTYLFTYLLFYLLTFLLTYLLTYAPTYLLTYSMQHSPSWVVNRLQLVKKFPAFYWTRCFITALTSALRLSLSWARTKVSVQVRGFFCEYFVIRYAFYCKDLLAPRPTPQVGGPPLVGCSRLLLQFIRRYPPYWRQFLHPQPADAPCCGQRDPLVADKVHYWSVFYETC